MDACATSEPFRFSIDTAGAVNPTLPAGEMTDDLVRQTRRELQRVIEEISALCQSRTTPEKFWHRYLSLVLTAMASDAGIVWQRGEVLWETVARAGHLDQRLLQPISCETPADSHGKMIAEVAASGGPVMVPPGSPWDSDQPGNPTELAAAVVPIPVDPDQGVEWLIEVFLPSGSGTAVQRGYLRFIAQMADLAADFLRLDRLRKATYVASWATRAAELYERMLHQVQHRGLPQMMVDELAELVRAERVSLVAVDPKGKTTLHAISGCPKFDSRSPVADYLKEIAQASEGTVGLQLAETSDLAEDQETHLGELCLRGVVTLDRHSRWRVILEDNAPCQSVEGEAQLWQSLALPLGQLLNQNTRGNRLLRNAHGSSPSTLGNLIRRWSVPLGFAVTVTVAALLPVPMVVTADGSLQPEATSSIYAPRDAFVESLLVEHGQHVDVGTPLIQLSAPDLEQSIQTANGRIAVLEGQIRDAKARTVEQSSTDYDLLQQLQLQLETSMDELSSLRVRLQLLLEEQTRLTLLSDRTGTVDAWQLKSRLAGRPVQRGKMLIRIIDQDGEWSIHAGVPENRLDHVIAAAERGNVEVNVAFTAFVDQPVTGVIKELGPITADPQLSSTASALGVVTIAVDAETLPLLQAGTPARVAIPCGIRPLGYIVAQDFLRMVKQSVGLYW